MLHAIDNHIIDGMMLGSKLVNFRILIRKLLPELLEMVHMAADSLRCGIDIVIFDAKLFTSFRNNRGYLGIVRLYDPREEVVSGLVVEGT